MTRPAPRSRSRSLAIAILLALTGTTGGFAAAAPHPGAAMAPSSPLDGWTTLRLEGRKFLVATGRSDIARHRDACGDGESLVTVHSRARIFGASAGEHLAASVIKGADDTASTRRFVERSGDRKARTGRVSGSPARYEIVTWRPADEDRPQPMATWSEAGRDTFDLPPEEGLGPFDAYGLLTQLGTLAAAGEGAVRVLTKRGPARLGFRVVETLEESMRVRDADGGEARRGTVRLAVVDLFPEEGGDDATVLNMRGETRLWVDVSSGALVRIEGEHESAGGRLTMRLASAGFGPPDDPGVRWPGKDERAACGAPVAPVRALDGSPGAS